MVTFVSHLPDRDKVPPVARHKVLEPVLLSPAMLRQHAFWQGLYAYRPVALGVAAWGMVTGVAMSNSGLSLAEALAMTLLVFAGTAQLAAAALIATGAPVWVILVSALCVNLRFVVFSMHLRNYVLHLSLRERLLFGYLSGDINYVLLMQHYPHTAAPDDAAGRGERMAWYMGNTCANYVVWCTACSAGVLLAQHFPASWGLGFAGTLAVLGILCAMLNSRMRVLAAVLAGAVAVLAWALPLKLNLVAGIVLSVMICAALEHTIQRHSGAGA